MAIANAVQRDGYVTVYNESGYIVATIPYGSNDGDGLTGYTAEFVNIKCNGYITTYNEQGGIVRTTPA